METSVIMSSTDPDGNEINRTYSGINPTATSEEITDFTEELNALSDNTYVGTTRRDITHVDREQGLVAYSLPTAAEDVKGGVMIGAGLSMTGDTLNCTISSGTLSEASTTDKGLMSADDKVKLNGISAGAQVNVIEAILIDDTPQTITNKAVSLNLTDYAKKSDISGVYKYKGTVGSLSGLSSVGNEVGDVYNVSMGGGSDFQGVEIKPGDNVAWNGSGWDALTGIVDLSNFVTKDGTKVLSSNDFSDAYKSKLDTLSGYTLPTANATQKGGVMIGEGLSMAGDTVYVTLQGGAGGGSYPIATSLEAGLMSAEDKQHLDSVFQSSADFADAVLTGVGGKFLPSVSSVSDYMYFKDSNIQFFDSKLQTLFDTVPFTANSSDGSMSFLNGRTTVSKTGDGLKNSLVSSMYSEGVSLPSDTSSTTVKLEIYKISETKGFLEARTVGDSHHNTTKVDKYNFYLKDTGQIVLGSADSIVSGGSASVQLYTHWLPSLKNPEIYALVYGKITLSSDNEVCSICAYRFNDDGSSAQSIVGSAASIGTYYYDAPASKTSIFTRTHSYQKPKVSYNNNSIIVRLYNKSSEETPFFTTVEGDYNSSKDYTASRYYLWCVHGATKSPAWSKILWCKWAEGSDYEYPMSGFDAEEMVGCYSDRTRTNWYIITCTAGTYPYSATWFNSAFKVWHFDPRTCDIQPCSKTLSQILPDLIL